MKKYLILSGLVLCLVSCDENVQQNSEAQAPETEELSEPLQVQTTRRVTLMPEAKEAVSEWLAYATAQNEIEELQEATGHEIIQSAQPLLEIMENLDASLPQPLQEPAVKARTNVLHTKAGILYQLSNKKNKKAEEIYRGANQLIEEFNNFKLQLNELYLKSPREFELELDREFEESQLEDTTRAASIKRQQMR